MTDPNPNPNPNQPAPPPVDRHTVVDRMAELVSDLERSGWQPADIVWAVERTNPREAPSARLAVLAEAATSTAGDRWVPPRWRRQLDDLADEAGRHLCHVGVEPPTVPGMASSTGTGLAVDWPAAFAAWLDHVSDAVDESALTACTLRGLPDLAVLEPPPATWPRRSERPPVADDGVDTVVLERVRALLAKAESTSFEAEAAAFTAKAQELVARHAIATVLLHPGWDQPHGGQPAIGRRLHVAGPYLRPKQVLLSRVAHTNRCTTVIDTTHGMVDCFGHADDLDAVELLFTSLLVQGTNTMLATGGHAGADGRGRTRSFRSSFLTGFGVRVGERLAAAQNRAVRDAQSSSDDDLSLVLWSRLDAAHQAREDAHHRTRPMRVSAANGQGWQAGCRAADRADLGDGTSIEHGAGSPDVLGPVDGT